MPHLLHKRRSVIANTAPRQLGCNPDPNQLADRALALPFVYQIKARYAAWIRKRCPVKDHPAFRINDLRAKPSRGGAPSLAVRLASPRGDIVALCPAPRLWGFAFGRTAGFQLQILQLEAIEWAALSSVGSRRRGVGGGICVCGARSQVEKQVREISFGIVLTHSFCK